MMFGIDEQNSRIKRVMRSILFAHKGHTLRSSVLTENIEKVAGYNLARP
jgi:hypothetical protein